MSHILLRIAHSLVCIALIGSITWPTIAQSDPPQDSIGEPLPAYLDQEAEWLPTDQLGPDITPERSSSDAEQCKSWGTEAASRALGVEVNRLIVGDYVAHRNGIWATDEAVHWYEFSTLGVRACEVQVYLRDEKLPLVAHSFAFMEDGTPAYVVDLRQLEEEAYQKQCGKYTPTLCAKVSEIRPDEALLVSAELQPFNDTQLTDAIAEQYPGIQSEKGMQLDPTHPDYPQALDELLDQRAKAQLASNEAFLNQLRDLGVTTIGASQLASHVSFYATRDQLTLVAALSEVKFISWADPKLSGNLMSSAVGSERVQSFWAEGIDR